METTGQTQTELDALLSTVLTKPEYRPYMVLLVQLIRLHGRIFPGVKFPPVPTSG